MMVGRIIHKEIVSHVLSLRFGVTFILFVLLVFASIYVTTRQYLHDRAQQIAITRMGADQLAFKMAEKDPESRIDRIAWDGRIEAVPVAPLSCLVQGLRTITPAAVNTSRSTGNVGQSGLRNPLIGLLPLPDLLYVVSVVLSLLAILFAFDSVCGEKESGTLALMLANPVPRAAILLGKWIGGYVVLVAPFLIAAVGALGYAWWQGALELGLENLQRIGMLLGIACIYISVFFTLSLLVSTLTHRSATSLFVCLLIWVVWILVVPNLAPVFGKIISPAPSSDKVAAEKAAIDRECALRISRLTATSGEVIYGPKIEQEKAKLLAEADEQKRRWDRFYDSTTERQTSISQTLGRLSPSACWVFAAVALTDTGPEAYRQLGKAKSRVSKDLVIWSDGLYEQYKKTRQWREFAASDVPTLQYSPPPVAGAFDKALQDMLILAVLNVVFFLGAFVFFMFYDAR